MSTVVSADKPTQQAIEIARRQKAQDALFHGVTQLFALVVLVALAGIIISLLMNAWPALQQFGPGFFVTAEWDIINGEFGGLIAIYGTLITSLIALVIAVPLSFGIALFLTELCPVALRRPLGTAVELLAAVPSIIYGMFGLFIFAPPLQNMCSLRWLPRWGSCQSSASCSPVRSTVSASCVLV